MVRFGGADNRRGDDRFCQEPSERYLSASNASRRGQLGNAIDDRPVNIYGFREEATVSIIGLGANTPIIGIPAQAAAGLGAPRNDADPLRGAEWQHFPLLLAVEQVHQVLHADKAGPAVEIGDAECAGELPRMQANDTIYGVAASVWTRNGGAAHKLAARIRSGTVWINCHNVFDASLPFGGYKQSGWGREMGEEVFYNYTEIKAVTAAL